MDNLSIWAAYARKNGMQYGKCMALVEAGILPRPKLNQVEEPQVIYRTCKLCGKRFVLRHSAQKYCTDECSHEAAVIQKRERQRREANG